MKVDIKSVLIGVLLTINVMLLLGSAPASQNSEIRYMPIYDEAERKIAVISTSDGKIYYPTNHKKSS